jgi:hypothetical protein
LCASDVVVAVIRGPISRVDSVEALATQLLVAVIAFEGCIYLGCSAKLAAMEFGLNPRMSEVIQLLHEFCGKSRVSG